MIKVFAQVVVFMKRSDTLDWSDRWSKLESIVAPYRNTNGRNYDCIVLVTGANDSYYIVHLVKQKLGLNPLLVTYNRYFNTPLGIRNLANLRIQFNSRHSLSKCESKVSW